MSSRLNEYQKIIDLINEPFLKTKEKPNIYGEHIFSNKALILIDMPSKPKNFHGSSYEFSCFEDICNAKGQIVVNRSIEKDVADKIDKVNCHITTIHQHPENVLYMAPGKEFDKESKESHIHFKCENKSYNYILDIAKFLRNF